MDVINGGKKISASEVYTVRGQVKKAITDIYTIIAGKAIKVWTAVTDAIAGVFAQGFWKNDEGWNNEDSWKNNA